MHYGTLTIMRLALDDQFSARFGANVPRRRDLWFDSGAANRRNESGSINRKPPAARRKTPIYVRIQCRDLRRGMLFV